MADWKVTREKIELFAHPNKEVTGLDLGRLGMRQVVVQKGRFKDGDVVIFVPEKSILPAVIADEGDMRKYLSGPEKNRVKSIRLKGEPSEGLLLDDKAEFAEIPFGEDISEKLNITKYEPPIPPQLAGKVCNPSFGGKVLSKHDVEQYGVNMQEFTVGEEVIYTEKIHGSQNICVFIGDENGGFQKNITSKGLMGRQLFIQEDEANTYWAAAKNVDLWNLINKHYTGKFVQVFGEAVPTQKGFNYGFTKPWMLIFRMEVDGQQLAYDAVPEDFKKLWVPILYRGPFDPEQTKSICKGMETVTGKQTHIKEGAVLGPAVPRYSQFSRNNFPLYVKIINPKYAEKETGEELS